MDSSNTERPVAAFVLSLLAGLWMLFAGGMVFGSGWGLGAMGGMMGRGGWMWGHGMVGSLWWPWFGVVAGIIVLIGAAMLYAQPKQGPAWGTVILIASALNLFLGMGGVLASLLGIIGGALALGTKT
ncbi:MAG: hypothetical protein ACE5LD_05600 [Candidatus Bipolaricaulia bacterium]